MTAPVGDRKMWGQPSASLGLKKRWVRIGETAGPMAMPLRCAASLRLAGQMPTPLRVSDPCKKFSLSGLLALSVRLTGPLRGQAGDLCVLSHRESNPTPSLAGVH